MAQGIKTEILSIITESAEHSVFFINDFSEKAKMIQLVHAILADVN